jgi:hypothetical protein
MTNLNIECGEIRELNVDETEIVSGGAVRTVIAALKLAKWISDNTGGSIDMGKMCDWARSQQ